jgi:hypothetical protein
VQACIYTKVKVWATPQPLLSQPRVSLSLTPQLCVALSPSLPQLSASLSHIFRHPCAAWWPHLLRQCGHAPWPPHLSPSLLSHTRGGSRFWRRGGPDGGGRVPWLAAMATCPGRRHGGPGAVAARPSCCGSVARRRYAPHPLSPLSDLGRIRPSHPPSLVDSRQRGLRRPPLVAAARLLRRVPRRWRWHRRIEIQ